MQEDFYFIKGETTWRDVARRVAHLVPLEYQEETARVIEKKLFVPSSPILRNTGSRLNRASCHDIGMDDNVRGIWQSAADTAQIFKSGGGGIGIDVSAVAPWGTPLNYAKEISLNATNPFGIATGPLSFMELIRITGRILGGGISGKAPGIMVTLLGTHPDIKAFIVAKNGCQKWLWFKDHVERHDPTTLWFRKQIEVFPTIWDIICHNMRLQSWAQVNLTVTIPAGPDSIDRDVWRLICENACKWADPGVGFIDNMNRHNPVHDVLGDMTFFNICGENPDYRNGTCFLGSTRLNTAIQKPGDWLDLRQAVRVGTRVLDCALESNPFPTLATAEQSRKLHRIGGGVSGWHTLLQQLGIPFLGPDALALAAEIAEVMMDEADKTSWQLAAESNGYMPGRRRNVSLMALAPNGHIAALPPAVSPCIYRDIYQANSYAQSLQMTPEQHVECVKVWQDKIDGGISYTASLPNDATWQDVDKLYRLSWEHGLKAMSVYRDGSLPGQPCKVEGNCAL